MVLEAPQHTTFSNRLRQRQRRSTSVRASQTRPSITVAELIAAVAAFSFVVAAGYDYLPDVIGLGGASVMLFLLSP